jgi:hypothetical protein
MFHVQIYDFLTASKRNKTFDSYNSAYNYALYNKNRFNEVTIFSPNKVETL